jgi:orotidine-5'-phosphate decarboxylase
MQENVSMTRAELASEIRRKKSVLCVGLDTDRNKIPPHLLAEEDPIFAFNKAIIEATAAFAVAFKPNIAFYEAEGLAGWKSLERTIDYLNTRYPECFTIADAKRGDIGNTSNMYAEAFLKKLDFDAITVAPYMGSDSVEPFLNIPEKWVILLALTSNKGAQDFQFAPLTSAELLYERVLKTSKEWGTPENLMYVVGATKAEHLKHIRSMVPDSFLLVPGVGAQGGSLEEVLTNGLHAEGGLLINSSRGVIYAGQDEDFAQRAAQEAAKLQNVMQRHLSQLPQNG